ncbi:hypothetical protein AAFF_G00329650 [Aldrovandia affinis]|uniref:Uncharacterized protein n=1 Tax=Aldrovandia affinis TaxID=143900 RepID=A0AAD7WQW1_9TELE|nr:hypothetical protein AAFF_G00329650 [Aldrovandia affinis]
MISCELIVLQKIGPLGLLGNLFRVHVPLLDPCPSPLHLLGERVLGRPAGYPETPTPVGASDLRVPSLPEGPGL